MSVALTVWTSGSAGMSVANRLLGLPDTPGAQAVAYAVVAAVSVAVAIWGFRWLVRCASIIAVVGGVLLLLMPIAFAGAIQWGYTGAEYLLGTFWATWLLVAAAIGVSGALVVCTILGDWTRYIRSDRYSAARWAGRLRRRLPRLRRPGDDRGAGLHRVRRPAGPVHGRPGHRVTDLVRGPAVPVRRAGGVGLVAQSLYSAGLDLEAAGPPDHPGPGHAVTGVIGVVLVYLGLLAPTVQGVDRRGVAGAGRAQRAVGGARRDRVPAQPGPLRR